VARTSEQTAPASSSAGGAASSCTLRPATSTTSRRRRPTTLEPVIARLAAARASDAALQLLEAAIDEQRRHGTDRARAVQAEGRFHRVLWRLAANAPLEQAMRTVYLRLEPVLDMAMRTADDVRASLAVHESTLAALRGGVEAEVAAAMDAHLALLERIYEDVAGRSFGRRSPLG
jgi:GntR family transcriptional repressor for pyruvate dehydrogenase complex